ncbi:hypothetical protein EJ07DRAFT_165511 [Lizonia empirigonia]|nr:hypothetical protein EJ07DRAFT_165511 [Lizonia empirigonia]
MAPYKSVKYRSWYSEMHKSEYINAELDPPDAAINTDKLNTVVLDWVVQVEDDGQFDLFILQEFQKYFGDWTQDIISAVDVRLRKAVKELLRHRGIYIQINSRDTVTTQLYPNPPQPPTEYPQAQYSPSLAQLNVTALTNLAKLYNENDKFSGDKYDMLSHKLVIFRELCAKVGIQPDQTDRYKLAISTMLTGKASAYYYQSIASLDLRYEDIIAKLGAYFHTTENYQLFLNEWRTIMLKDVIASNPDKTIAQCLNLLIDKLHKLYQAMAQQNGLSEPSLTGQLVSACQGVEACSAVLIRPASTFEAVASELCNAVGNWQHCHPHARTQFNYDNEQTDDDIFYTNRRYNRNDEPRDGCWSTRHSREERNESHQRFKTYVQNHDLDDDYDVFLAGFEGIELHDEAEDDDGNRVDDLDAYFQHEQFNTAACGTIDGQALTINLNDAAATHAITGIDPYASETAKEAPHMFTFDHRYGAHCFQGIMPDTGAAGVSTAGKTQVMALQRLQPSAMIDESTVGRHRIRFGDNPECLSLGDVKVETPLGVILFAVMPTNTPFLLCLADMDRHGIYLNNVDNVLVHESREYPIVRKWGHPWLLLDDQETATHYLTEVELAQLHRRFGHPAAGRLHKVLARAGYNDITGKAPGRFQFTLRDDIDFNYRLIVDVMYINQRPVLHAVDEATAFQAARFLTNMKASTTWDTLRAMWIDMYVGPPDVIATDAGKNFASEEFVNNAKTMAIEVERYHAAIRRAFEVISADMGSDTSSDHLLQMAVKAVNDTAGPDGLVPTLLVFGIYPRLSKTSPPSPSITARAKAIKNAMAEVRKIKAKRQVNDALATRNGPNVIETLQLPIQSSVKVWRENRGWTGPHTLIAMNDDLTAAIVDPYHRNNSTVIPRDDDDNDGCGDADDDEFIPETEGPPPRKRGRPKGSKNKPNPAPIETNDVNLTQREEDDLVLSRKLRATGKITTPGEPFELSTKAEIDALITRGVFRFEEYDPQRHGGIRVFKPRIVKEVKGKTTTKPYEKSCLVVQGYADDGKRIVLTQSPTIQRASQRIVIALAPSLLQMGMTLWLRDITQAYTQADDHLQRTIIADLPTQLRDAYPKGTIMVVVKPLYGIAEAGAYWWSTYFKHHTTTLGMETSTYDPCLLITKPTASGFGIVSMQTDDTLGLSDDVFANKESKELRFSAKEKQFLTTDNPIDFNGCVKKQGEKLEIATDKKTYIQQRARGAYIVTICQPEASFDLAAAAQASEPTKEEISKLNKRIEWQKRNLHHGLTYVPLDVRNLKLFTLVDASFANNKDMSSHMGFVIVLGNEVTSSDKNFRIRGNIVHWSSVKCKRITRSVLASEIYAMAHGVDIAVAIGGTIDMIMERLNLPKVPIVVCTDSRSLYDCLVKLGTTKEKRLMIDIMAMREAYERSELMDIRWIDGRDNPADSMTKAGCNAAMENLINSNELNLRVQGWVNRDRNTKPTTESTEPTHHGATE